MNDSTLGVDVNLVIRLVADPDDALVRSTWERWDDEHRRLAVPTPLFYEVANELYRCQRAGMMGEAGARMALEAALALPIHLYGEPELHGRAIDLAERLSLPAAYDAHYLALAEWLGAEFWTADGRLVKAVQYDLPWVRLLEVGG